MKKLIFITIINFICFLSRSQTLDTNVYKVTLRLVDTTARISAKKIYLDVLNKTKDTILINNLYCHSNYGMSFFFNNKKITGTYIKYASTNCGEYNKLLPKQVTTYCFGYLDAHYGSSYKKNTGDYRLEMNIFVIPKSKIFPPPKYYRHTAVSTFVIK